MMTQKEKAGQGVGEGVNIPCACGFKVESLVPVDERGQMVLPKEVRERAGIKAGDKLALTTCEKDGKVFCITLIKAEDFATMVRDVLGPMLKDVLGK